jgi:HTH-type transcriptional regulator / antitoxin HipB
VAKKSWNDIKRGRLDSEAARAGYERARHAFELGERVRQLREEHGLSQRELAEKIGSTQPAIARLEGGGVAPSIDTLERVAGALGTKLVVEFAIPPSRSSRRRGTTKVRAKSA